MDTVLKFIAENPLIDFSAVLLLIVVVVSAFMFSRVNLLVKLVLSLILLVTLTFFGWTVVASLGMGTITKAIGGGIAVLACLVVFNDILFPKPPRGHVYVDRGDGYDNN